MAVEALLDRPFESQLRDNKPKEAVLTREESAATTEPFTDLADDIFYTVNGAEGVVGELDRFCFCPLIFVALLLEVSAASRFVCASIKRPKHNRYDASCLHQIPVSGYLWLEQIPALSLH